MSHNQAEVEPSQPPEQRSNGTREAAIIQSWMYKKAFERGFAKGVEKGLRPLVHVVERRLARSLTAAERAILVCCLYTLGPECLGDLAFDASPDELAAWLAAPDAR